MALRTATRRYDHLPSFLREYPSTLKVGAVTLPAAAEEYAPEIKLDIVLPGGARFGPMLAQVVFRLPDGSTAVRIPEVPADLKGGVKTLFAMVDEIKAWLLDTGQVSQPAAVAEMDGLRARIAELEAQLSVALSMPRSPAPRAAASSSATPEEPGAEPAVAGSDPVEAPTARDERGFACPNVDALAPALSGSLSDRSLRDGLMAIALEHMTGVLTVRYKNGKVRRGFWDKGGPVGWRTDPVDDEEVLGVLLYRAKQISKEQLAQSLEMMERTGCRQGEAMIELGIIAYPQLVMLLQKQAEFVLQRVMADREGEWTFHTLDRHIEKFIAPPVRVAGLLFKALRVHGKEMTSDQHATALRPLLDSYVYLAPNVSKTVDEMKLSADDLQFLKILSSTSYRLRELFSVSNLPRSQTAVMIWVLNELQLLEYKKQEGGSRSDERLERYVMDRKRQMLKGTLFDRLELHWMCNGQDVQAKWQALSPEVSPETIAAMPERFHADMNKVADKMREAHSVLSDDKRRAAYRLEVVEKTMIEQSAEMLFRKGDMAIMKGSKREATDCFAKAVELRPNNPEYHDGLKRARAMV